MAHFIGSVVKKLFSSDFVKLKQVIRPGQDRMDLVSVCCDLDSCAAEAHLECDGEEIDLFAIKMHVIIIALMWMEMIVFWSQDHTSPRLQCW